MHERDFMLYLDDIKDSINNILLYTENISYDSFFSNNMRKDAAIRNIEIIGEAVKKIPEDIKTKYSNIEWRKIAGLNVMLITILN